MVVLQGNGTLARFLCRLQLINWGPVKVGSLTESDCLRKADYPPKVDLYPKRKKIIITLRLAICYDFETVLLSELF